MVNIPSSNKRDIISSISSSSFFFAISRNFDLGSLLPHISVLFSIAFISLMSLSALSLDSRNLFNLSISFFEPFLIFVSLSLDLSSLDLSSLGLSSEKSFRIFIAILLWNDPNIGIFLVWIFSTDNLPILLGTPISISRSNLPGLRSAGSSALGMFDAAMTTTFPLALRPSIIANSCATTLFSTSPCVSSLFEAIASISSMNIIDGAFFSASSNFFRRFASDSP